MNICVIGSCRVHSPLKKAGALINRNAESFNGLCHTTKEVLQKIQYSQGELEIPADLVSLIDTRANAGSVGDYVDLSSADIYFIEISSRKEVFYESYYLQLDCIHNYMKSCNLPEWCSKESSRGVDLGLASSALAKKIASGVSVSVQDVDSLVSDMLAIKAVLGKPVVIVGHVVHRSFMDKVAGTRYVLNSMLKVAARHCGVYYCDIARIVDRYGSSVALIDFDHWNPAFEGMIGAHYIDIARCVLSGRGESRPWLHY